MGRRGIVVGGGAAGMTAAIAAAAAGAQVTVLEHMPRAGKKILSTGNGKCNMTNRRMDAGCYRCDEPDFPMRVIGRFPVEDTLLFFRKLGIRTTERNGYVYPASEQASAVLDALLYKLAELSVPVLCECGVRAIRNSGGRFLLETDRGRMEADFVILAAGSKAAPSTGSDGSGYALAKMLGHRVIAPLPALVQLRCDGKFLKALSGVRAEASVTVRAGDRALASDRGELQLADYGISGIPVFQISRFASRALGAGQPVTVTADFAPGETGRELFLALLEQRAILGKRRAAGFLDGFFNKKLAAQFLKDVSIGTELSVSEIGEETLCRLAAHIKSFEFSVTAANPFPQAQTCAGGVDTAQIDGGTMESKLIDGLYFAGEIVDVDGICGGYNLQWAWSSGHLAGASAAKAHKEKRRYI